MDENNKRGYQPSRDEENVITDPLAGYPAYVKAMELYHRVSDDTDLLMNDPRSREIASQIIRSAGSISANFEEGYGRATTPEFIHRLRIATGEARETRGWYHRSKKFLPENLLETRLQEVDEVIALLVSTIAGLERRRTR
jgi:four helix bundle protein